MLVYISHAHSFVCVMHVCARKNVIMCVRKKIAQMKKRIVNRLDIFILFLFTADINTVRSVSLSVMLQSIH